MPTDWQPHEQLSGSSNLTVREMMDDAIHRARADAAGVDAGKLVDERIAELEAALKLERRAVEVLARRCEQWSPPVGLCDHDTPLHGTCAACWAAWARKQAREEAGGA